MNFSVKVDTSRISRVLESLDTLEGPIHVAGGTASSRAWIAARRVAEARTSVLLLAATDDLAEQLATDLETLSKTLLNQPLRVVWLPGWDPSPYSPIAPSIKTRLARTSALCALAQLDEPALIVSTIQAASMATLPLQLLKEASLQIRPEQDIQSREALARRLSEAGYLRTETVQDPGTFAVRGDLVDVYPSNSELPIRIELFGEWIERFRTFDPSTQRTHAEGGPQELMVGPAREVLIHPKSQPYLREQLKNWCDEEGVSRSIRDPLVGMIQDGIYPERIDHWAPFAYPSPATLLDYLPQDCLIAWDDELSCTQSWDELKTQMQDQELEAKKEGRVVPPLRSLFLPEVAEKQLHARARLFLDRLELASLEESPESIEEAQDRKTGPSTRLRVFVKSNDDLGKGSRHSLGELVPKFKQWLGQGYKVLCLASTQSQLERLRYLLQEHDLTAHSGPKPEPGLIALAEGSLSAGFRWPAEGLVILTEEEIVGAKKARRKSRSSTGGSSAKDWSGLQALSDLSSGEAVVHVDHGIGRYLGLSRLDLQGAPADFLQLEYANKDKLYLPVYRLNVIQKYVGSGDSVALDKLGASQFQKEKERVRSEVKRLAFDLVQLYAERKMTTGVPLQPRDSDFQEFESAFPFEETPDQLRAIDETLADLSSGRVTDRLICGDVGYGKTEVAIRAAYSAVSTGKQVAVLVPTTILAQQHEQSFRARFKDYPVRIESVSRFKNAKEQKLLTEEVAKGAIDIIVGTHRLLSKDVKFKDLGLIIVDEEHRFGVEHKERLKTLKVNTHVLTLTATPIPRTLHMALAGLRDISLMSTPPVDRLPIKTYVSKFDESLIQRAVEFELGRGGQVFFVHNRIETIDELSALIQKLVPKAQVAVGHGQMTEGALEKVMLDFYEKRANVLVSTSIIESGLDVPNANTLIIDRADMFGLAQLYQIRGRVGRGQSRAYAYLLLPEERQITEDAKKRLEVIQKFVELGSGFSIASHDLEIRGGGDLLGPAQSGHIAAVGFELYTELLEEAIHELQGKAHLPDNSRLEPEIKAPFPAFLDEAFVPDVHQRLSLYRRFSAAETETDLDTLELELKDRFGALPEPAVNLIWLVRIKQLLKKLGVAALTVGPEKVVLLPGPASALDPARAISLVSSKPKLFQLTPDSKFVASIRSPSLRDLFFSLESLFKDLLPHSA